MGTDGYFHIKYAYLLTQQGPLQKFPWTTQGLWSHSFADKEFLFHLYLAPFTALQGFSLPKISSGGVSFYTLTLLDTARLGMGILGAAIFSFFFYLLKKNKVPLSFLWTLALLGASLNWLYRLQLPRAHVMSIFFFLLCLLFILRNRPKALFVSALVYPLAYHAAFVILGVVVLYNLNLFLHRKALQKKVLLACAAGMMVGYLAHPNVPNNLYLFYVQNVKVLSHSISGQGAIAQELGGELRAATSKSLLKLNGGVFFLWAALVYLGLGRKEELSSGTRGLLLLSLAFFPMVFVAARFGEYWVPLSMLFFAHYFRDILAARKLEIKIVFPWEKSLLWGSALLVYILVLFLCHSWLPKIWDHFGIYQILLLAALGLFFLVDLPGMKGRSEAPEALSLRGPWVVGIFFFLLFSCSYNFFGIHGRALLEDEGATFKGVGTYIAREVPEEKIIYTCCWDLFPYLFYWSHRHRYLFALDPSFLYNDPQRFQDFGGQKVDLWDHYLALKECRDPHPERTISEIFKAQYGVVHLAHLPFIHQIQKNKSFKILYRDNQVLLFKIEK